MTEDLYKEWGANIKRWRTARGKSRAKMAEDLEVSLATISRWEDGLVMPRDGQKLRIAKYLDLPPFALFPLTEVPS